MKKDYSSVRNFISSFPKPWYLVLLAGLISYLQSNAANVVSEFRYASNQGKSAPCSVITTLPCGTINVQLPFSLDFNGSEGGLTDGTGKGTGFRMADAYSGAARAAGDGSPSSALIGYEPSRLKVANSVLTINAHKGLAHQTNNNQINALGVGVEGTGRLIFETTVINPINGSNSEQAGLWVGLGDKTFLKLAATGNKVEMRRELNDVTIGTGSGAITNPHQRLTEIIPALNTSRVRLRLVVDFINNRAEGFYSLDGINYVNVGTRYTAASNPSAISIGDMGLSGQTLYGGIFASKRNSDAAEVKFNFDNFSVKQAGFPTVTAPYRINAGGIQRTVNGAVFAADDRYAILQGDQADSPYALTGSQPVPELYYERRVGYNIAYAVPIANGTYTVKLHMVENYHTSVNSRLFDVALEGATVLDNIDLYVAGGNQGKAVVTNTFQTKVTDGVLNIDLTASKDKAIINAVEILPVATANVAPVFENPAYTFTVAENALVNAQIGAVVATDAADQAVTYSITGGNAANDFEINAATGAIRLIGTLDFDLIPSYTLTVKATDNGSPAASAQVAVKVNVTDVPDNKAPVVITAPENQNIYTNQPFSFITGSFSDPDADDVLTYTASRADGTALPSWIVFNPAAQTFSGTAPGTVGTVSLKITAVDKALAATSANFTVTVEALPTEIPCNPISTLPCERINVTLPFVLNFDGTEGGLLDKNNVETGFTMVDAPSGTRLAADGTPSSAVTGFEPSKLTVANGRLSILTNKGIALSTQTAPNNNQINTLGVGTVANGKLTIETTLINPVNGSSSEQAGLWYGLNDKSFLKLVVTGNKVEMRKELNDVTSTDNTVNGGLDNPDQRFTGVIANLNTRTVRLRLIVDIASGKAEGFYSTDGTNYLSVGARYTNAANPAAISIANMNFAGKVVYAGIYATHRNGSTAVTYNFDNFSVTSDIAAGKVLTFTPNALDFSAMQGQQVAAKTTTLAATVGTPAITFTSTSASWFTLPAPALGEITFGPENFSSTMAPGIYETSVTATADGYEPATLLINLTVASPATAQAVKVNFQDPATVPPTGWVKDFGQPFGLRTGTDQGADLEYGWKRPSDGAPINLSVGGTIPGNGRRRTTPDDITQATLMHMQADDITASFNGTKAEGYWEMKVESGIYDVTVSVGDADPSSVTEIHTINVEGVNAISNFVPTGAAGSATRFASAKVRAAISDGHLTINANGGTNTKINSVIITPIDLGPYLLWSTSEHSLVIDAGTNETIRTTSLDLFHSTTESGLPISLSATYGPGASNWLSFSATHNGDEPNVTFNYINAKHLAVGTYTATVTAAAPDHTSASTLIQITVMAPGANQPYVISSTPLDGATNVSVNITPISANNIFVPAVPGFPGGVDNGTITTANVKLFKIIGDTQIEIEALNVNGTGGHDAISFKPKYSLELATKYKFVVTSDVKSYTGASFLPYEATFTTSSSTSGVPNPVAAEFAPKEIIPGTVGKKYTCITFGPDDRLYALRLDGVIERFNVDHTTGLLSQQTEISTLTAKYGLRSSVGLVFAPESTAENLIAYISHCSSGLTNAPEFDGNISRLTGANLETEELILTKLPRSKADHLVNSITFGPDGALYFNQGSNSSMGSYDGGWQRDETLLSASLMRLDLSKLAGLTLPLDVRTTANQALINAAPTDNIRMADGTYNPYAVNSPLTIYASGIRNAVDMVWHTNGQLYVPTNGSAAGGVSPASVAGTRRPDGTSYSGPPVISTNSVKLQNDWLFRVNPLKPVGYFGHPNPLRGEYAAGRGYTDNPRYPETQGPDANYRGAAYDFAENKSPNGVIEYKSNAFNGALKGRILVCRFSGGSDIIVMEPGSMVPAPGVNSALSDDHIYDIIGAQTGAGTDGITGLSGFANPLDLTEDVQTGNLYVIEYNWNNEKGKTSQLVLVKVAPVSEPRGIATLSPASIVENDVAGGEACAGRTVTVANTGNAPLTVTGITLDGIDKTQYKLEGAPTPSEAAPLTIARGSAVSFNVVFNPTSVGVKKAQILVTSVNNPVQQVSLSGLGTAGLSGTSEPSLQLVLDAHSISVNVGDDNKNTNIIHSTKFKAALLGEEISVQAFERAGTGLVTVEPLSVFGPKDAGGIVTAFGWYTTGQPNAKNELFTVANNNYQTLNVQANGSLTFDPAAGSFGFYSRWPAFANRHLYSEDALNTFSGAIPHHVRVYKLKDSGGTIVENAYVVATEEHISGFDYQDIVVIVRNVKPFGAVVVQDLAFSKPLLSFSHVISGSAPAMQTATLTTTAGNPALSISKSPNTPWLILPNAALGTLSFGIDPSGLTAGTYESTVTVSANGFTSATMLARLTVTAPARSAIRINAGGPAFSATGSRNFIADQYFGGTGNTSSITGVDILNTTDDVLYRTERSSAAFNYTVPVQNGYYHIILHFSENWYGAPGRGPAGAGRRQFHVDIEGSRKLTNYDIFAKAGGALRAIREVIPVEIADGELNVNFLTGSANSPKVSAIEVVPVDRAPITFTLAPQADAHVRDGSYAAINYGNEAEMLVKSGAGNGITRSTYLKFSLSNVNRVGSAKLRIYGNNRENTSGINLSAYGVDDDSWTETGINFSNAPAASAAVLSSVNVNNVAQYYELDVTSYIQAQVAGDKVVSLQLRNPATQNKNLAFNSRENAANQPQLIIESPGAEVPSGGRVSYEVFQPAAEVTFQASRLYPNPGQKRFTVELSDHHTGNISLEMISEAGRTYPVRLGETAKGGSKAELDVTSLSLRTGVYLLRIQSASKTEIIRVLVVD